MKICESCGMPLDTKTSSRFDDRYCIYCQDQETGCLKNKIYFGAEVGAKVGLSSS